MVEIYKTDNKVLQKLDNIEEGCWVNMIDRQAVNYPLYQAILR